MRRFKDNFADYFPSIKHVIFHVYLTNISF